MKKDSVFLRERRVWAAETPGPLLREPGKEESVGKRSGDKSCVFGLAVRAEYLDSGGSISGGCGRDNISLYSMVEMYRVEIPLSGEFAFFVGGHEQG